METTQQGGIGGSIGVAAATAATAMLAGEVSAQTAHRLGSSAKTLYWVATVTPCNERGDIDHGALKAIMQFHKKAGADGVVVMGTSGEFPSYSVAERKQVSETVLQNRNGMNIIINPGTSNIGETVDLARHAESIGADGLLVIPPFYFNNPGLKGITRYYSMLFDQVGLPINPYHIPGTSEVPITIELLKALYHYPNLAGIKDSGDNREDYAEFISNFPDLNMRTGWANTLDQTLDAGMGGILAEGNAFSAACADIFKTYRAKGAWKQSLQKLLEKQRVLNSAIRDAGVDTAEISTRNFIMSVQMEGPAFFGRAPLGQPDADTQAIIRTAYAKAKSV